MSAAGFVLLILFLIVIPSAVTFALMRTRSKRHLVLAEADTLKPNADYTIQYDLIDADAARASPNRRSCLARWFCSARACGRSTHRDHRANTPDLEAAPADAFATGTVLVFEHDRKTHTTKMVVPRNMTLIAQPNERAWLVRPRAETATSLHG
jgi:hypothetical protein